MDGTFSTTNIIFRRRKELKCLMKKVYIHVHVCIYTNIKSNTQRTYN